MPTAAGSMPKRLGCRMTQSSGPMPTPAAERRGMRITGKMPVIRKNVYARKTALHPMEGGEILMFGCWGCLKPIV